MKNFKDYYVTNRENQEEIHVLGGVEELSDSELEKIANSFGIKNYRVELWECRSALKDKMVKFEYYSYNLCYGNKMVDQNEAEPNNKE